MARSGSDSATMGSDFRAAAPISWTVIPGRLFEAGLGAAALGLDRDALEGDRLRGHHDLDLGPATFDAYLLPVFPEADPRHSEDVRTRLKVPEGEEAEVVGQRVGRQSRVRYRMELRQCAFDGTAVLRPDPTAELVGLRECGERRSENEEREHDQHPRRES